MSRPDALVFPRLSAERRSRNFEPRMRGINSRADRPELTVLRSRITGLTAVRTGVRRSELRSTFRSTRLMGFLYSLTRNKPSLSRLSRWLLFLRAETTGQRNPPSTELRDSRDSKLPSRPRECSDSLDSYSRKHRRCLGNSRIETAERRRQAANSTRQSRPALSPVILRRRISVGITGGAPAEQLQACAH